MFAKYLNMMKNENVLLDPNSEVLCPPPFLNNVKKMQD